LLCFDCVDYFASLFLFFCSSSYSPLYNPVRSHGTSTYCKHTVVIVVIVRASPSNSPYATSIHRSIIYLPAFGPCCSLSFSFIILPLDHTTTRYLLSVHYSYIYMYKLRESSLSINLRNGISINFFSFIRRRRRCPRVCLSYSTIREIKNLTPYVKLYTYERGGDQTLVWARRREARLRKTKMPK
jgi:hypothetical protein